ncbi:MAG: H-NS histone family protein [Rhodocyclaceae bacterium]|nr:H-NS histone family protein [Rhodocyclaceae bacterium]
MGTDESLDELEAQQAELTRRIEQKKKEERTKVLAMVRQEVLRFGLTADEIMPGKKKRESAAVPVKYRNQETGETWTGRGRVPNWLAGLDKEQFLIQSGN